MQAANDAGWGVRSDPIDIVPGSTFNCDSSILNTDVSAKEFESDQEPNEYDNHFGLGILTGICIIIGL